MLKTDWERLIHTVWNPLVRDTAPTRVVDEKRGKALAMEVYDHVASYEAGHAEQAMRMEIMQAKWPDIRQLPKRLADLCGDRRAAAEEDEPNPWEGWRSDRSHVIDWLFRPRDGSTFARHVCDSTGPLDVEWFDLAIGMIQQGSHPTYRTHGGVVDMQRYLPLYEKFRDKAAAAARKERER